MKLSEIYKAKRQKLKNMTKNGFERPTVKESFTSSKKYDQVPK